jgi:hypothetical protein
MQAVFAVRRPCSTARYCRRAADDVAQRIGMIFIFIIASVKYDVTVGVSASGGVGS